MTDPVAAPRTRPQRVRAFFRRTAFISVVVSPIALVAGYLGAIYFTSTPSVVITEMHEDDSVAIENGTVNIVVHIHRIGYCPTETQRYMWRPIYVHGVLASQFVPLVSTVAPLISPTEIVVLSLALPPQVTPGDWFYQSLSIERCSIMPPGMGPRMFRSPNLAIRVNPEQPAGG